MVLLKQNEAKYPELEGFCAPAYFTCRFEKCAIQKAALEPKFKTGDWVKVVEASGYGILKNGQWFQVSDYEHPESYRGDGLDKLSLVPNDENKEVELDHVFHEKRFEKVIPQKFAMYHPAAIARKFQIGDRVRYIGETCGMAQFGKVYTLRGYNNLDNPMIFPNTDAGTWEGALELVSRPEPKAEEKDEEVRIGRHIVEDWASRISRVVNDLNGLEPTITGTNSMVRRGLEDAQGLLKMIAAELNEL